MNQQNIVRQTTDISHRQRCQLNRQTPAVIWLTGLSGAGKSAIANAVDLRLWQRGQRSYVLDGDNMRHGLCADLGFSEAERSENIRRVGEVAKLFVDAGQFVVVALISPMTTDRERVRQLLHPHRFIEVFVDTPLSLCEQRDPKGLYRKARAGEIPQFTGIDAPYQAPAHPDIHLQTADTHVADCANVVVDYLSQQGFFNEV